MIKDMSYFSRTSQHPSDESGRSLIEMLGTIAIITMITVGAISGAGVGMSMWKAAQTREDVMSLIVGIQDLYSWSRDGIPNDWDDINLCDQNLIDRDCENNVWTSAFGTDISISANNDVISVKVVGIPALACKNLKGFDSKIITSVEGDCPIRSGVADLTFIHNPYEAK